MIGDYEVRLGLATRAASLDSTIPREIKEKARIILQKISETEFYEEARKLIEENPLRTEGGREVLRV